MFFLFDILDIGCYNVNIIIQNRITMKQNERMSAVFQEKRLPTTISLYHRTA